MRHFIIPLSLLLLAACDQRQAGSSENEQQVGYTKEFEYAVDVNMMFHTDLNDDDFSDVSALISQLTNDVLAGKLQAYDPNTDLPMAVSELESKLKFTDTVYVENPETGLFEPRIASRDFRDTFYSVKFKESWHYEPNGSIIARKVTAISPRIPVYSSDGEIIRGYTSLFTVKL